MTKTELADLLQNIEDKNYELQRQHFEDWGTYNDDVWDFLKFSEELSAILKQIIYELREESISVST